MTIENVYVFTHCSSYTGIPGIPSKFGFFRSFTIVLNFFTDPHSRILSHPIFNMRCIPFLLLGLISATYAIPTPLPQSITNQVIYEHWARSAETDIEKWTSPDALSVQDALLYQDAQHWAAEFIEQRLFREALGVQARFPRDGRKVLYSHPRHLRFRLLSPYLYVIAVRGFVMSKSPADITAHLAVDHDFLFATKTACDVEVDFGDKFAVAHFKPLHAEDNPHRDPKIIIPLNDRDRELFKKCDDLPQDGLCDPNVISTSAQSFGHPTDSFMLAKVSKRVTQGNPGIRGYFEDER
ncbi:hypothetical protein EV360DRAFT_72320 [Lentinula raphanica]|nr:hypothetical protein EV360DRAFT_72320 [Lentinula raphanica]